VLAEEPGAETKTYTNPVGDTPLHMGDPFVLQHDGGYYLFGTTSTNEGFRYWESSDLVRWNPKGFAYRKTQDSWGQSLYWAPEVRHYRDKFYMTYMPAQVEPRSSWRWP
jgi:beta-xylosidase